MKKMLAVAAAVVVLPIAAQAQTLQYPGFYAGIEGGGTYMFQTTLQNAAGAANLYPNIGWAGGAMIGYDFVGPRFEVEGVYRYNSMTGNVAGLSYGQTKDDIGVLANLLYDFNAGGTFVPYIGAGAGVAFVHSAALGIATDSTVFAYQGIIGVGYNIDSAWRVNLDGRYYGTSAPTLGTAGATYQNNNISAMLSLQYKFGAPTVAVAPPQPVQPAAPSFMVFFDWDRSNLSAQAVNTIKQAAAQYKTKGSARVTATGHTDKSGPDSYNMALSLRRANTVKDALVREGVPATAISVIGKGETQPLVQTADGVREPQNRRVEIVIQ